LRTTAPFISLLLLLSLGSAAAAARPVEIKFQTADAANLLWMIDQMSRWDPRTTSPSYRDYWDKKIGLTEDDLEMLERYSRVRRRLSGTEAVVAVGDELDLLGNGATNAAEQYFLAFLEIPGITTALNTLPADKKDKEMILCVLKHFGKKIGTKGGWKEETAHLKSFESQTAVLAPLADPSGFLTRVKAFLGITEMPAQITVDALWAPPGSTDARPAIVGFHVVLPLPADAVQNDEAVVRQIAVAVGEATRYMIGKLPDNQRRDISQRIIARAGLVNPTRPRLLLDALATVFGQELFLKERFPDLSTGLSLSAFEPSLPYPYAVDELARALLPDLLTFLPTPGAFTGGFLDKALQKMDQLYPPRFRALASVAVLLGPKAPVDLFRATFAGSWRANYDLQDVDGFVRFIKKTRRPSVILINHKQAGTMNTALKKLGLRSRKLPRLRRYRKKSVIYPVTLGQGYGPLVVIAAKRPDDFRKAFVELHRMQGLPVKPMIITNESTK